MPDQINPTIGLAENLFKDLVWDSLVKAGLAALFSAVPALAIWPIGSIITYIVNLFSQKLFEVTRLSVDLGLITLLNGEHKAAYDSAAVKLKILAHDFGPDSPEFKKAKDEAKVSLSKFVQFNR